MMGPPMTKGCRRRSVGAKRGGGRHVSHRYDVVAFVASSVCGLLGDGAGRRAGMALKRETSVTGDAAQVLMSLDPG